MDGEPFRRGRFEDLPDMPRIPHPYADAPADDVLLLESARFGTLRMRVVSYGSPDAPPLLLVHGLMTSSYSWRYMLEPLGERYRLIVPDLPGCGGSDPVPGVPRSGTALATVIGELQAELGIDGCPAVGNSLGVRGAALDPRGVGGVRALHGRRARPARAARVHARARASP